MKDNNYFYNDKKKISSELHRYYFFVILQKRNNMGKISSNSSKDDLRRAISMDEMLVLVKQDIHELFKNRKHETSNKRFARSKEVLSETN